MNKTIPSPARAANLLGIVSQLYISRMNSLLQRHDMTLSQFSLLNHLLRSPKDLHSITDLTDAMEMNQPGVSKIVKKLQDKNLIKVNKNKDDSRKREVCISDKGKKEVHNINMSLFPEVQNWFEDWHENELERFNEQLMTLGQWFDKNRLTEKP